MRDVIHTADAPAPGGPYSQAVRAGGLVFLAGQIGHDPVSGELADAFEAQARQTFRNLEAVARAAGGSLADAVRIGIYLRDMGNFATLNEVYGEFLSEPYPARTTIQSDLPGFAIEVDAVLWLGG